MLGSATHFYSIEIELSDERDASGERWAASWQSVARVGRDGQLDDVADTSRLRPPSVHIS